jgi:hypothetical protein
LCGRRDRGSAFRTPRCLISDQRLRESELCLAALWKKPLEFLRLRSCCY